MLLLFLKCLVLTVLGSSSSWWLQRYAVNAQDSFCPYCVNCDNIQSAQSKLTGPFQNCSAEQTYCKESAVFFMNEYVSTINSSCASAPCSSGTELDEATGKISAHFCTQALSLSDLDPLIANITSDLNMKQSCPTDGNVNKVSYCLPSQAYCQLSMEFDLTAMKLKKISGLCTNECQSWIDMVSTKNVTVQACLNSTFTSTTTTSTTSTTTSSTSTSTTSTSTTTSTTSTSTTTRTTTTTTMSSTTTSTTTRTTSSTTTTSTTSTNTTPTTSTTTSSSSTTTTTPSMTTTTTTTSRTTTVTNSSPKLVQSSTYLMTTTTALVVLCMTALLNSIIS